MSEDTCFHSYDEWKTFIENGYDALAKDSLVFDERLRSKKDFMSGPVAVLNGKPIVACSRKGSNYEEAIEFMLDEGFIPYLMYSIVLNNDFIYDPITLLQMKNPNPTPPTTYYIVRGAILNKETS